MSELQRTSSNNNNQHHEDDRSNVDIALFEQDSGDVDVEHTDDSEETRRKTRKNTTSTSRRRTSGEDDDISENLLNIHQGKEPDSSTIQVSVIHPSEGGKQHRESLVSKANKIDSQEAKLTRGINDKESDSKIFVSQGSQPHMDVDGMSIISCVNCRNRKVRCPRDLPSCRTCLKRGQLCVYPATKRTRSTMKRSTQDAFLKNENFYTMKVELDNKKINGAEPTQDQESSTDAELAAAVAQQAQEHAAVAAALNAAASNERTSLPPSKIDSAALETDSFGVLPASGNQKVKKSHSKHNQMAKLINAIYSKHPLVHLGNVNLKKIVKSPNFVVIDSLSQQQLQNTTSSTSKDSAFMSWKESGAPPSLFPLTNISPVLAVHSGNTGKSSLSSVPSSDSLKTALDLPETFSNPFTMTDQENEDGSFVGKILSKEFVKKISSQIEADKDLYQNPTDDHDSNSVEVKPKNENLQAKNAKLKFFKELAHNDFFAKYNPPSIDSKDPEFSILLFTEYCLNSFDFKHLDEFLYEMDDLKHPHPIKVVGKLIVVRSLLSEKALSKQNVQQCYSLLQSVSNELFQLQSDRVAYINGKVKVASFFLRNIWESFTLLDFIVSQLLLNRKMITKVSQCFSESALPEFLIALNSIPLIADNNCVNEAIELDGKLDNLLSSMSSSSSTKLYRFFLIVAKIYAVLPHSFSNLYLNMSMQRSSQLFFNMLLQDFTIFSDDKSAEYKYIFPVIAQILQTVTLHLSYQLLDVKEKSELVGRSAVVNSLDLLQIFLENIPPINTLPPYLYKPLSVLNESFIPLIENEPLSELSTAQSDQASASSEIPAKKDADKTGQEKPSSLLSSLNTDEPLNKLVLFYSRYPKSFWNHLGFC